MLVLEGPLWPRKETTIVSDKLPPDTPFPGAHVETPTTVPRSAPGTVAPGTAPGTAAPGTVAPPGRIAIDDFMKVELRVAKVLAAERVPKSKKLLKLNVDVGTEQRTLVAGIAEAYSPKRSWAARS